MAVADWEPTVDDVGGLLRDRTRANGTYVGTFTAATQPTDVQVQAIIGQAADTVSDSIGTDFPSAYWQRARSLTALRAAMLVELSFFGQDVAANRSPFPQLKALFDEDLPRTVAAIGEGGGEDPGDANLRPQGGYAATDVAGVFGLLPSVAPWGPDGLGPRGVEGWAGMNGLSSIFLPW